MCGVTSELSEYCIPPLVLMNKSRLHIRVAVIYLGLGNWLLKYCVMKMDAIVGVDLISYRQKHVYLCLFLFQRITPFYSSCL